MSFLILAVIILASADRITSATVGPLLGTIAGYIFGRSVQAGPEKPRKTEMANNQIAVVDQDGANGPAHD